MSQILEEYLNKYAGDEYAYQHMVGNMYTIVYKILEKTKITKMDTDSGCYKISNCEVVDMVYDNDIEKKIETCQAVVTNVNASYPHYEVYNIGDFVDDSVYIYVMKDLDRYINECIYQND